MVAPAVLTQGVHPQGVQPQKNHPPVIPAENIPAGTSKQVSSMNNEASTKEIKLPLFNHPC